MVTGAEDGSLRRIAYSADRLCGRLHSAAEVGEHVAGTAVKALATLRLPDGSGPDQRCVWCD